MLTAIVVDRNGKVLSDEELKNKVINKQEYYDIVLPIRKRINDEFTKKKEVMAVWANIGIDIRDHINTKVNLWWMVLSIRLNNSKQMENLLPTLETYLENHGSKSHKFTTKRLQMAIKNGII